MKRSSILVVGSAVCLGLFTVSHFAAAQKPAPAPRDSVQEAQTPLPAREDRVEQRKTTHDRSDVFNGISAPASSPAFAGQPDQGRAVGFDFSHDPFNAKRPMQPAEEIMQEDTAAKRR